VSIPRERHEDVAAAEEEDGGEVGIHFFILATDGHGLTQIFHRRGAEDSEGNFFTVVACGRRSC